MSFQHSNMSEALAAFHALVRFFQHMNSFDVLVEVSMKPEVFIAITTFVGFLLNKTYKFESLKVQTTNKYISNMF